MEEKCIIRVYPGGWDPIESALLNINKLGYVSSEDFNLLNQYCPLIDYRFAEYLKCDRFPDFSIKLINKRISSKEFFEFWDNCEKITHGVDKND